MSETKGAVGRPCCDAASTVSCPSAEVSVPLIGFLAREDDDAIGEAVQGRTSRVDERTRRSVKVIEYAGHSAS